MALPAPHLACTPARPGGAAAFAPGWRTETVLALARGITATWAFDRLPVLADALEDAGCDDPLLLRHCREGGHHTARCWVLGAVFDRPPVAEPQPPRRLTDEQVRREVEFVTGRRLETDDGPIRRGSAFGFRRLLPALAVVGAVSALRVGCPIFPHKPPPAFRASPPVTPPTGR